MTQQIEFGRWLRAARIEADLTQEAFAKLSGISCIQICNIESGRTKSPRPLTRQKLIRAINTSQKQQHKLPPIITPKHWPLLASIFSQYANELDPEGEKIEEVKTLFFTIEGLHSYVLKLTEDV